MTFGKMLTDFSLR